MFEEISEFEVSVRTFLRRLVEVKFPKKRKRPARKPYYSERSCRVKPKSVRQRLK